ncbi:transporter [Sphingomonas sp. R-74633]|uniref:SphA family protein n=1 Tax=Sphingomonas sp. R-74633 TaxID=2751188 RepID=UPI0015D2CB1B|nr:transporter [Sphingomonas sp. R-74633]NYT42254.1 transporter [Sphingomonas sp. R-74633]
MTRKLSILLAATAFSVTAGGAARADENGSSVYLLGSGGPATAVQPPLTGIYIDNTIFVYTGGTNSQRDFKIGGSLVTDVDATIAANFTTLVAVPSTNFLGGTLAIGGVLPVGAPMIDASAVITGPLGRQIDIRRHDANVMVGDPIGMVSLGWKSGKFHAQLSGLVNIPVGYYRADALANLSFHRWAEDVSGAMSFHDEASGWDVSSKVGITFNGNNKDTDYDSGNDFHAELSVEKALSKKFSIGVLGYHFEQLTGDTGGGATQGPYKGRVSGVGGTMAFNTVLGRSPASFRIKVLQEFGEKNRTKGTAFMLDLSLPLHMNMPKQ